ncbi:MAG: phosphate/phosphite/phosphonate ABC transporter substrate-binding protein [Actinomycetota bacterium]|nr:phosphate/phosphite/phosphonate ABC transporter substrate-binding protein [Actinomycetota bacterium]
MFTGRNRPAVRLMAALFACALVVAACGSDDDDTDAAAPAADESSDTAAADTEDAAEDETADEETSEDAAEDTSDWPEEIIFAAVPADNSQEIDDIFGTTIEIIEGELGVGVEFFKAIDYAGVIEAAKSERVDVAVFGPFSYYIATQNDAPLQVGGVMMPYNEDQTGPGETHGYQSFFITGADNDEINSLEDISNAESICLVDPGSTSGNLVPRGAMLGVGFDIEEANYTYAGGHDASVLAVQDGTCDAGFAFDEMVRSILVGDGAVSGVVDEVDGETYGDGDPTIKVVFHSDVIPGSPIAVRSTLPESFVTALTDVLQNNANVDWAVENGYCTGPEDCSFSDEDSWGWIEADDSIYAPIDELCELTQAAKCQDG